MGGCEHHYLSMTWAVPITSKNRSNKAPKRGKWVVCLSRFACITSVQEIEERRVQRLSAITSVITSVQEIGRASCTEVIDP